MKPRFLTWPDLSLLLAAAGGLGFFLLQHRSAGQLEEQNARLSQRIEAWEKRSEPSAEEENSGLSAKALIKSGPSGMVKLAAILRGADTGNPAAFRESLMLDSQFRTLDSASLERMIAEARAAELSEEDRERIVGKLLDVLVEKDAVRAFAVIELGFAGKTPREIQQQLSKRSGLFEKWILRDSPQALAWLDRQVAAGLFESRSLAGTSGVRQEYEALIFLRTKDGSRIAALDPLDRLPTLQSWRFQSLKPEEQADFAKVVRTSGLKPSEVVQVLKPLLNRAMESGDLAGADAFLERVAPTPEELPRLSESAAGNAMFALGKKADQLTGDEVPAIRTWLADKSSEGDAYIGSMIGRGFSNGWDAAQIFTTLDRLQKDKPSDDLVFRFLLDATQEGHKQKLDPATALDLANRISDPEKRADALNYIGRH
jgi:hypothetical protein